MRRLLLFLLMILCPVMMGAAAPVTPTESFYVNDYGAVLTEEARDTMTRVAADLYERAGLRLVFLSAGSLDGQELSAYADGVITGWEFNGDDVLFLVFPQGNGFSLLIGENVDGVWEGAVEQLPQNGVMGRYGTLAKKLYEQHGVAPGAEIEALLGTGGSFGVGTVILFAVLIVAAARAFRLDRKYKGKYLKSNVRKRRSYARTYNEEDEYNNEKIYKNTYDEQE